jgi:hypothetical protein
MKLELKKLYELLSLSFALMVMLFISSCQVDQAALQRAAGAAGVASISSLSISQGNNQTIAQNTQASQNLEVIALDTNGNAASGVSVKFQIVTSDGGFLNDSGISKTITTGEDGKASVSYTSGSLTGQVSIVATASLSSVTFTQTVFDSENASNGSSGSTLLIVKGNNQTVAINADASEELEVLALNSSGAPMPDVLVTFEVYTPSAGKLTGNVVTKTVNTSAAGKANVVFSALSRLGQATIIATSSAGSAAFSVNVIDPDSTANGSSGSTLLIVKGNNQTVAKNSAATDYLEVMALNSAGAPMEGVAVTFEVFTAGSGTLTGGVTTKVVNTLANGKATVAFNALANLGSATIIATSSAGSGAFNISVVDTTSGSTSFVGATLLMVKGNNNLVEQNSNTTLEVLALDSTGLPIENMDVTFEVLTAGSIDNPLPATGTASGGGLAAKTGSNGRASVVFTAPSTLGTATVIARSGAGSAAFNLSVGVQGIGSTLSISSGNGQVIVPNTLASQDLEVIATSASGSPLAGITVTFTVTTNNGGVLSNSQGILVTTTDANGKAGTQFTSSNTSGPISVLASSSVGSVTFALNTSTSGSGSSGGNISFNPETLSPASGSWLNTNVGAAPSKSVTVTNTASYSLYINSIFTTATTPFTILSDDCPRSPLPLLTTASCTIVVSFSPTSSATFSKFLFLNWSALNDGSNGINAVLPLEGSGPPALTFVGISSIDNVTTTSMRINWAAATGGTVSQYRVYQITNGVPSLLATLPAATLSYSLTSLVPSTTYTYRVRAVNTANEEDGNSNDVSQNTDNSPVPVLTSVGHFVYPTNPVMAAGAGLTLDFNKTNATPVGDAGMSYTCKYSRQVTGVLAGKANCNQASLLGTFTFNALTGAFSWVPKLGTQGVFEFVITGTDVNGSGYRYFTVDVAHPYAATNLATLISDFRASFGALTQPNSASATSWSDITGQNNNGSVSNGSPLWAGSVNNTNTDPQRVTFNGTSEIDLGSPIGGYNKFMIDYWISNPETTFTNGSTVLKMDDDSTDNGFKITQNTTSDGKRALRLDFERSYARQILADDPAVFWRMDNLSGTSFNEYFSNNRAIFGDGAYGTTTTTGLEIALPGVTLGELSSKSISVHTNKLNIPNVTTLKPAGDFTIEFWVKYANKNIPADHTLYTFNTTGTAQGLSIYVASGVLTVKYKPSAAATVTLTPTYTGYGHIFDENWHHIVFTSTNAAKVLYVDSKVLAFSNVNNGAITWPSSPDNSSIIAGADATNPAQIDEVAVYSFSLSSNQVQNHLAAADHFVKMQALYPANSISQTGPAAYWRMGDGGNGGNYQDYSGNQNNLSDSSWATYGSPGVYMRPGGSRIDNDGAGWQNQDGYRLRAINMANLTFNDKFTFSNWVNFTNYSEWYRHSVLFSFVKYWDNYHGVYCYISNDGYLYMSFDRSWGGNPSSFARSVNPVLPSYYSQGFSLGWYHLAVTYDGTKATSLERVQFYINGMPIKMTSSGTIPTSLSALTGTNYEFQLGTWRVNNGDVGSKANNGYFIHDEDAAWAKVLNGNEIRAQANEGSLRYCDIPVTSRTLDPVNAKPFDFVNMLFDGTTINVTRNSRLECALRPVVNLTNEALALKVGAPVNGFKGHLTDIRIHGTDGASVAASSDVQKAFTNSSDQHRITPIGNIVTDNLVRQYEASAAFDGVRPYGAGCENTKVNWVDIGFQGQTDKRQENAYLHNFNGCTTGNGWNGDGSPTNPYRLTFDGNDDWVDLGTNTLLPYSANKFSVCMWASTTKSTSMQLFNRTGNYSWGDINLIWNSPTEFYYLVSHGGGHGGTYATSTSTAAQTFRNGSWHYLCGVYDGAKIYMYLDGTSIATPTNYTGNVYNWNSMNVRTTLGAGYDNFYNWPHGGRFQGDIGAVHLYNGGLTVDQVKQNCNAQAANYNVTTCAP